MTKIERPLQSRVQGEVGVTDNLFRVQVVLDRALKPHEMFALKESPEFLTGEMCVVANVPRSPDELLPCASDRKDPFGTVERDLTSRDMATATAIVCDEIRRVVAELDGPPVHITDVHVRQLTR